MSRWRSAYEAVRETWKPVLAKSVQRRFREGLAQGAARRLDCGHGLRQERQGSQRRFKGDIPAPTPKDSIEIIFRPDPNVYDGRW